MNPTRLNDYWTNIYYHLHYPHKEKVTHQIIRLLQHVQKNDQTGINHISSYLKISHNTASDHVKRAMEKEYLVKQRDPLDERKVILRLTDRGTKVLYHNTSLDEEKVATILTELTHDEQQLIEHAFKLLSERAKQCTSS